MSSSYIVHLQKDRSSRDSNSSPPPGHRCPRGHPALWTWPWSHPAGCGPVFCAQAHRIRHAENQRAPWQKGTEHFTKDSGEACCQQPPLSGRKFQGRPVAVRICGHIRALVSKRAGPLPHPPSDLGKAMTNLLNWAGLWTRNGRFGARIYTACMSANQH